MKRSSLRFERLRVSPVELAPLSPDGASPGTGSFHPATIEAVVEVTKLLEPSMEGGTWRLREQLGCKTSER